MKARQVLRAPAKLNLTLEVLDRRPDGYHRMRSVMVPLDLCDEIQIECGGASIEFDCSEPALAGGNLVERALHVLRPEPACRVFLDKRIPTQAGLGGGSSDAAAVLLAAQAGVFGPLDRIDYLAAARELGSDVPFFLVQTGALVEGTGERVTALGAVPPWHALVVKPPVAVSTAWAYEQLDRASRGIRPRNACVSLEMVETLQRRDFKRCIALLQNDFHDVIVPATPEIRIALDLLRSAGADHALLTGSGSCVFTLTESEAAAREIVEAASLPEGFRIYRAAFWNGEAWRSAA